MQVKGGVTYPWVMNTLNMSGSLNVKIIKIEKNILKRQLSLV